MRGRPLLVYEALWVMVVGMGGVVAALRAARPEVPMRVLIPFSAYLPFVMAAALVLVVASSLAFRSWGSFRVPLVAATVLLPAVVYGPRFLPHLHPEAREMIRVATWNAFLFRHGVSGVKETIGRLGADLLAIQEVPGMDGDSSSCPRLEALVESMGYRCAFVGYRPHRTGRQAGIAICVRDPLRLLAVERRLYHPGGQWGYVFAEADVYGQRVNVVVPHLYPFSFGTVIARGDGPFGTVRRLAARVHATSHWHLKEGAELLRLVGTFRDPTILLGDFNSAPDHPIHWRIRHEMVDCLMAAGKGLASTFTFFLPIRIDYIYVTPSIRVHAASVVPTSASDHKPVVAVLSLPPPTGR